MPSLGEALRQPGSAPRASSISLPLGTKARAMAALGGTLRADEALAGCRRRGCGGSMEWECVGQRCGRRGNEEYICLSAPMRVGGRECAELRHRSLLEGSSKAPTSSCGTIKLEPVGGVLLP